MSIWLIKDNLIPVFTALCYIEFGLITEALHRIFDNDFNVFAIVAPSFVIIGLDPKFGGIGVASIDIY